MGSFSLRGDDRKTKSLESISLYGLVVKFSLWLNFLCKTLLKLMSLLYFYEIYN